MVMSSSTVSASTPAQHPFTRRSDEVKPSKTHINALVMDYLVAEGYPQAAKHFASEANVTMPGTPFVQQRVEIRSAIYAGDLESAIQKINDWNPQILELDPSLHFALLRLQLIELIRTCIATPNSNIMPAVTFAQSQLAPRASRNTEFLRDLELAMALLIFPPEKLTPPLAALFDPKLRETVANRVNEAILASQCFAREAKIKNLVRLRAWAEEKAREAKKDLPSSIPLGLDADGQGADTAAADVATAVANGGASNGTGSGATGDKVTEEQAQGEGEQDVMIQ